jgi:hypothetical protein
MGLQEPGVCGVRDRRPPAVPVPVGGLLGHLRGGYTGLDDRVEHVLDRGVPLRHDAHPPAVVTHQPGDDT